MEREEKERQGKVIKNGLFDPAKLVDTIGFTLEIANSSICTGSESGGGLGVFVKKVKDVKNTNNNDNDKGNNNNKQGVVPPGTVLALFPGKVHLAEFSSNGDYLQQELLPDNDLYLMVRADGQIVGKLNEVIFLFWWHFGSCGLWIASLDSNLDVLLLYSIISPA